jgi:uncharacterized RDD family membrane protein YckC
VSDLPPPPPPPPPGSQPPQPGGYGQGYGPQQQKAGPWIRFLGRFIDGLVLLIPSAIIAAIVGGGVTDFGTDGSAVLAGILTTLLGMAYFVWLESTRGQTVGKMVLSLRVHGPGGALPSTEEAFKRNAWYLLGIVPVIGGLASFVIAIAIAVTISNDAAGRGLHDNFAGGTLVTKG